VSRAHDSRYPAHLNQQGTGAQQETSLYVGGEGASSIKKLILHDVIINNKSTTLSRAREYYFRSLTRPTTIFKHGMEYGVEGVKKLMETTDNRRKT